MALPLMISLAEAAAFTIGCAVLNERKFDPDRVGVALILLLAALIFVVLITVTPTSVIETAVPEPDELYTVLE